MWGLCLFAAPAYGVLGHGPTESMGSLPVDADGQQFLPSPTMVESVRDTPFQSVSAGYHHSLAATVDGVVYAWGYSSLSRLGVSLAQRIQAFVTAQAHMMKREGAGKCHGPRESVRVQS